MERRRGVPGGWSCLLAALGALLAAGRAATPRARFSPFFFLCTHHGELEGDGEQGEVLIALHIAGNPAAYVPGQEYHGKWRPRVESVRASPRGDSRGVRSPLRPPVCVPGGGSRRSEVGGGARFGTRGKRPVGVRGAARGARSWPRPGDAGAALTGGGDGSGGGGAGRAGNAAAAALRGHPEVRRSDRAPSPPLRKANFQVRNVSNSRSRKAAPRCIGGSFSPLCVRSRFCDAP